MVSATQRAIDRQIERERERYSTEQKAAMCEDMSFYRALCLSRISDGGSARTGRKLRMHIYACINSRADLLVGRGMGMLNARTQHIWAYLHLGVFIPRYQDSAHLST